MNLPTPADLVAEAQRSLRADLDPQGTGAVDLSAGSDLDLFVSAIAAAGTPVLGHVADRVAARTLSSATGGDLDEIAQDIFQDARKDAAPAAGTVYLTRALTGSTVIPKGSRFAVPATSSQVPLYFAASADVSTTALTVAVAVTCTDTGAKGNVRCADITKIVDPLPDSTWALYVPTPGTPGPAGELAPAALGGGADRETDDALRTRLQKVPADASRQRGTKAAILFGALRVPGVADAIAIEPGDGSVVLFVGDAQYVLPTALQSAIATEVDAWRAYGVPVILRPFAVSSVIVTLTVYMQQELVHYDTAALGALAQAAVLAYFAPGREHPDEYILSAIGAKVQKAIGVDDVQEVVFAAPGADVLRGATTTYGGVSSLPRFVTDSAHVTVSFAAPQTT